jgi:hypothetical protein
MKSEIIGMLIKTDLKYKPIRHSSRAIYKDSTGKEWVKLGGKWWPKLALEGYTFK